MSIGMPYQIYMFQFGELIRAVFDAVPYHVGSSLDNKTGWRDVDVRVILSDEDWDKWELGKPGDEFYNKKWISLTMAYSELGRKLTGLPIDFQIQQRSYANKMFPLKENHRSALVALWER